MIEVTVTQADRKAAADLSRITSNVLWANELADVIEAGKRDRTEIVQAFARSRQQAEDAMRERCAKVAEVRWSVWAKMPYKDSPQGDAAACAEIADAIRGLGAVREK